MKNVLKLAILFFGSDCLTSNTNLTTNILNIKAIISAYIFIKTSGLWDGPDGPKEEVTPTETEDYLLKKYIQCSDLEEYRLGIPEYFFRSNNNGIITYEPIILGRHNERPSQRPHPDIRHITYQDEQKALWDIMTQAIIDGRNDVSNLLLANSRLFGDFPRRRNREEFCQDLLTRPDFLNWLMPRQFE